MNKKILVPIIMVLILVGAWFVNKNLLSDKKEQETSLDQSVPVKIALTDDIEKILNQKTLLLMDLVKNKDLVNEINKVGDKNSKLSQAEIESLDQKWQKAGNDDDFIKSFINNMIAKELIKFQEIYPAFTEIFITDTSGLNVGQTSRTSDYFQADEDWWIKTYNGGTGLTSHGEIEFDESSQTDAIAIYVPIFQGETEEIIGVMKAILDINAIKSEL